MAPVKDLRTHPACLVGTNNQRQYARAVNAWLQTVLSYYSPDNVRKQGRQWIADRNDPPRFEYSQADYKSSINSPPPADLLLIHKGSYAAARKVILQIALDLLAEARPADRKAVQDRMRAECPRQQRGER